MYVYTSRSDLEVIMYYRLVHQKVSFIQRCPFSSGCQTGYSVFPVDES